MTDPDSLPAAYTAYIDCINRRDLSVLDEFVAEDVLYNGERVGLSGYRGMLEGNYRGIPDLRFAVELLVCNPPYVASRLAFDCSPTGQFLGLAVNGRRVRFAENVFYRYRTGRISEVWSVIDKAAIEAQL
jgi:predicted ester cyclase